MPFAAYCDLRAHAVSCPAVTSRSRSRRGAGPRRRRGAAEIEIRGAAWLRVPAPRIACNDCFPNRYPNRRPTPRTPKPANTAEVGKKVERASRLAATPQLVGDAVYGRDASTHPASSALAGRGSDAHAEQRGHGYRR